MKFLDFLFPPSCPICNSNVSEHGSLCHGCWSKFNWISDPKCCKCGYPFPADLDLGKNPLCPICAAGNCELDWMRSACVYDDFSRNIMLPFKHAGALHYQKIMSRAMIGALGELKENIDLIVPVPLAYRRLWKRGYNQATLLARPIAKYLDVKIDTDSVCRKYRPDMGHKNAKQRAENIRGVFSVIHPEKIKGKTILLVDDVMTTGSTFMELNRVLKKAGAHAVYGIVFCRVVRSI
ncbi:MAG: ComF family protein [Alphaproteobacteria bacterium]|nr:ComF family protein [Alphaproteobacteria bacterium]MBN2675520.1 ComF family protein [Alphaproteobacteria bacterium]